MISIIKPTGLYFELDLGNHTALSVVDFELDEAFNTLLTLTIRFVSDDASLKINDLILDRATFSVQRHGIVQRRITGVVASMRKGKTGFHRTFYTVVIRPSLWLLTQRHTSRLFHNKTIPAVLEQLMQDYGITHQLRLEDAHVSKKMIVQRREYDFEFFDRLAAEEGLVYWFETDDDGKEICHVTDTFLGFKRGKSLQVIYNENQQNTALENVLYDVSYEINMTAQSYLAKDRKYAIPKVYHTHSAQNVLINTQNNYQFYDGNPLMPNPGNSDTIAQYRLEALQNHAFVGSAKGNYVRLQPGKCFKLSQHPDEILNQRWQPFKAKHIGKLPQSMQEDARNSDAAVVESKLWFIEDKKTWRPLTKPKPTAEGPETAIVVGPENEEIFTNKLGEVMVQFHWDLEAKATCWVRVAQDWSGSNFGFYAIPRVGQEVIISYLEGDLDRPIVSGSVYNGADRHPLNLPAEKTHTIMKTKTYKGEGYNELRFVDEPQKERIYVHAQKDMETQILHDEFRVVGQHRKTHIHQDEFLKVDGEKREQIAKDYSLTIEKNAHIATQEAFLLKSETHIHLEGKKRVVIDAGDELVLKVGNSFIKITEANIKASSNFGIENGAVSLGQVCAPMLPEKIQQAFSFSLKLPELDFSR